MAGILSAQCSNQRGKARPRRARPPVAARRCPAISAAASVGSGRRSASAAPRSTTSPTTATASYGTRRMPSPRTSIRPASVSGADEPAGGRARLRHARGRRRPAGRRAGAVAPAWISASAKPRFARARRPADQHRARTDQHCGGVDGRLLIHVAPDPRFARRRTVTSPAGAPRSARRAPSGRRSGRGTPMRFSARMRPPCASTIWREIEGRGPEFCPKP